MESQSVFFFLPLFDNHFVSERDNFSKTIKKTTIRHFYIIIIQIVKINEYFTWRRMMYSIAKTYTNFKHSERTYNC